MTRQNCDKKNLKKSEEKKEKRSWTVEGARTDIAHVGACQLRGGEMPEHPTITKKKTKQYLQVYSILHPVKNDEKENECKTKNWKTSTNKTQLGPTLR